MASKFNEAKIFEELDKLNSNELYIYFGKIKAFISSKLEAQQKEVEEKQADLQNKIDSINRN